MVQNAASRVVNRLRVIRDRAATVAPKSAVKAMAEAELVVVATRAELSKRSHAPGVSTNAPPGEPPARVSGALRDSLRASPPVRMGGLRWMSQVGATVPYARIQELGGTVSAKGGWLVWQSDGSFHRARQVTLLPRPYLKPATDKLIASGELSRVAARAFMAALEA